MKYIIYFATFFTLIACKEKSKSDPAINSNLQKDSIKNSTQSLQDLKTVEDIKKEYAFILSEIEAGSLDSISFNYNCYEEKKGTVTYFLKDDKIRKIKHAYTEYDHHHATDQYFIKNDSLFFVYYNQTLWQFDSPNVTKDQITEKRFYIINNKPVQCLEKEYFTRSSDTITIQSNDIANTEVNCTTLQPVLENYTLLKKYSSQTQDLTCLEN